MNQRKAGNRACFGRRRISPQRAGLRVSALTAEITTATEMVTANWRKSWPLIPGRKPTGANTATRTRVVAITGPVISAIAWRVASRTGWSGRSSRLRVTFSTTTIASSTTRVIASTIANRSIVLAE